MRRAWLCAMILLATGGSLAAQAKHPNTREGLWVGFGFGWGSAGAECQGCSNQQVSGLAGNFRIGATLSQNLLLGFETNGWFHTEDDADQIIRFYSGVILFYPEQDAAFYFKAGVGLMDYFAETALGELTANAAAASLGAGYEFRVGRNMSITPFLNSLWSTDVEFELDGISADSDVTLRLFQLGVGIVWH